jgi:hypothetical protein
MTLGHSPGFKKWRTHSGDRGITLPMNTDRQKLIVMMQRLSAVGDRQRYAAYFIFVIEESDFFRSLSFS